MTILRLPRQVVDQIAAGEVVERPASVVKELVENALDAGATRVRVEVDGGGLARIAVHDDGAGIAADELELALAPHATSKIRSAEDLLAVSTFGFRGEALASIASIAHVTLSSKRSDTDARDAGERESGAMMVVRGGAAEGVKPVARAAGTTIEVRDLFFNTPARRKFLKAEPTELGHVMEAVLRLALARPDAGFELVANGRRALELKAGQSLRERIAAGFGRDLADSLLEAKLDVPDFKLRGLLAPPNHARARTNLQHLWINGRFVRDRTVQGAVRAAFRDFLAESLTPAWFLFLEIPAADVDCNVHPTKIEVRLRRSSDVYRAVLSTVERTLRAADLTPRFRAPAPAPAATLILREPTPPYVPTSPENDSLFDVLSEPGAVATAGSAPAMAAIHSGGAAAAAQPALAPAPSQPGPRMLPGTFVQIARTYVATATAEGLLVFDQHALHERVLYRHLREQWRAKSIRRQELLSPLRVELPAADVLALEEASELLESIGIRVAPFSRTAVAISSLPAVVAPEDVAGLISRLVAQLRGERPEGRLDDFADRMLFTMACHRAVRAGDPLSEAQITGLLAEAERIEHAHTCPHGRPTRVLIPLPELENLFKRRGF